MEISKHFSISLWGSQTIKVGEFEPQTIIEANLIVEYGKVALEILLDGKPIAETGVVGPGFRWRTESAMLKARLPHGGEVSLKLYCPSIPGGAEGIVSVKCIEIGKKEAVCPACGAPVVPGANYCWKCGAKLSFSEGTRVIE